MRLSLIFPVFNEEANIQALYDKTKKIVDQMDGGYEIIFVNDGSWDNTLAILFDLHEKNKNIKIINFSRNFGHQNAVSAGLRYAEGDCVAILDADLQDNPEILPAFIKKLDEGFDVVYAIRKKRKENFIKRLSYSFFYRMLKSVADINIPLDSGDFCVMSKRVVKVLNSLPEKNRFIRGLRSWVGFKQTGIEYERSARFAGESKYTLSKMMKLAFDGIFSFSYMPLQFMFFLGLLALILSFVGIVAAVYMKFFTTNYALVPGFATTIILVMFVGGLQLFSIGLVGEYLRRVYDEIKQRPSYIIESLVGFGKEKENQHS